MDSTYPAPFFPGGEKRGREQRRRVIIRAAAWALVILLHVAIYKSLVFYAHPDHDHHFSPLETFFLLPPPQGNIAKAPEVSIIHPDMPRAVPPAITIAPITLPRMPTPEEQSHPVTPGDILGAVGQNLACSAGSYEHLTQPERERCRREPWVARKLANGSLVMVPSSVLPRLKEAPQEFRMTGSDQIQHDIQAPSGCPILLNTPCLSDVMQGKSAHGP